MDNLNNFYFTRLQSFPFHLLVRVSIKGLVRGVTKVLKKEFTSDWYRSGMNFRVTGE